MVKNLPAMEETQVQSMGLQRVRHDWVTNTSLHISIWEELTPLSIESSNPWAWYIFPFISCYWFLSFEFCGFPHFVHILLVLYLSISLFRVLLSVILCFSFQNVLFQCWDKQSIWLLYVNFIPSSSVQLLSHVQLFVTLWTAACQASLSITISRNSIKLMSIKSVMPFNHLILHCPLLLLPSIFPSIRVFSNESVLCIRCPKYWHFSFSISPSNEYSGLISFRMDWLDLFSVQGTLKSLLQYHSSKTSIHQCSAFFIVQLSCPSTHDYCECPPTLLQLLISSQTLFVYSLGLST